MLNLFNILKKDGNSVVFINGDEKVEFLNSCNGYVINYLNNRDNIEDYPEERRFFYELKNFLENTLYSPKNFKLKKYKTFKSFGTTEKVVLYFN